MSAENDDVETPPPEDETEALRAEVAALKDRSLRAMAEVENVRKRAEREREDIRAYAVTRFARDLLTVADNLARALAAFPPEARAAADDSLKAVLSGIDATERELQTILARNGVKPIEAAGQKFDPHLHQAIAEVSTAGRASGTVVSVVQGGYTIGERLLRPAMVTVAKGDNSGDPAGACLDTKV